MPSSNSHTVEFICGTVRGYFGDDIPASTDMNHNSCVHAFLEEPVVLFLSCCYSEKRLLCFSNEVESVKDKSNYLVFLKTRPIILDDSNIRQSVIISSVVGPAIQSFYNFLKVFYTPLLLKLEGRSAIHDPKLQKIFNDLTSELSLFMTESGLEHYDYSRISSLSDEVAYWKRQAKKGSGTSTSERERGEHFAKLLDPAAQECARLECMAKTNFDRASSGDHYIAQTNIGSGLSELLEVLDPTLVEALDEAWRCLDMNAMKPYPESRMRELLETLGYWVVRIVQYHLGETQPDGTMRISVLWTLPYVQVKRGIQLGIQACDRWDNCCRLLTQQLWHRFPPHPWNNEQPNLAYMMQFRARLNEVLELRGLYEHLQRLLTETERTELGMLAGLEHFLFGQAHSEELDHSDHTNIPSTFRQLANPLAYSPFTAEQWASAMSWIDTRLQTAEELAATRLRMKLLTGASEDGKVIGIFQRKIRSHCSITRMPTWSSSSSS
ncbi:hypothetical protein EG68_02240 [Paragonimus skrjabini miyazakii]|uniref:Uncharacterized protein n=1 Tax=Paragonimus skrjabini miyazakii TaxID=59628 RepID=A0A8S9Z1C4_9TREM|nr:hypothetical protein EG68_02240 [Paragonimus skrjabini miyazakii]